MAFTSIVGRNSPEKLLFTVLLKKAVKETYRNYKNQLL